MRIVWKKNFYKKQGLALRKKFKMNEKNAIVDWLDQQRIKNYSINEDLTINVQGNVNTSKRKLTHIPVQFHHVTGYFDCSENKLISLKGSPLYIDDDLYAGQNQLIII